MVYVPALAKEMKMWLKELERQYGRDRGPAASSAVEKCRPIYGGL